jgi:hypothetical protein
MLKREFCVMEPVDISHAQSHALFACGRITTAHGRCLEHVCRMFVHVAAGIATCSCRQGVMRGFAVTLCADACAGFTNRDPPALDVSLRIAKA